MAERREFVWVAHHPGLDLVNTEIAEGGRPRDLLEDADTLLDWLAQADLVDDQLRRALRPTWTAEGEGVLAWTKAVRGALRRVVDPTLPRAGAGELDALVGQIPVRLGLSAPSAGSFRGELIAPTPRERLRARIAQAALGATELDLTRVRRCAGTGCVLLFYDTSRGGQRRWCRMESCGNRAKSATHYRRSRASGARER